MSFDPSSFTGAGAPRAGQLQRSSGFGHASERITRRASVVYAGLGSADVTEPDGLLMQQARMAPPGVPFAVVPAGLRSFPTTPAQPAVSAPACRREYAVMDWPAGEAAYDVAPSDSEELLAAITNAMISLGTPSRSANSNALTTQSSMPPGSDFSAPASGLPHPDTASALLGYLQPSPACTLQPSAAGTAAAVTRPTAATTARMQLEALTPSSTGPTPCVSLQPAALLVAGPSNNGSNLSFNNGLSFNSASSSGGNSGSSINFSNGGGSGGRLGAGVVLHALQSQATAARARRLSWQPQLASPSSSAKASTASPAAARHALLPPSSSLLSSIVNCIVAEEGPPQTLSTCTGRTGSPHPLYKTEVCKSWDQAGACSYGDKCQFAHGAEDLRLVHRHPKYRTKVCHSFLTTGSCLYGHRCRFIHGGE